jgi:arginine decarboxylase
LKTNGAPHWTAADSAELYGIRNWGAGYFDLSDDGAVTVNVQFPDGRVGVSIPKIIEGMRERGWQMPVLLRIENLLDAQITVLNESFARAIAALNYSGTFRGVFPIKVNQQCQVIEEIARFGSAYGHGLEAGSKAELLIALATLEPGVGHIVCNGYKDEEFVSLGLQALRLGYRVTFVIETPTASSSPRKWAVRGARAAATAASSGSPPHRSCRRSIFCGSKACSTACNCCTTTLARRFRTSATSAAVCSRPAATTRTS